jgi:FkbM family methyltransferase
MISFFFKFKSLRNRLKFHFLHSYFHELQITIPVGADYWANLCENDSYDSFSEIFIQQEYCGFIPEETVLKVLDVGANYGYFSLWLQSMRPHDKIYSTLIEPSLRCRRSIEQLVESPKLKNRFQYLQRAIGDPKDKKIKFFDRPYMTGSIFESDHTDSSYHASTLKTTDVLSPVTDSYDLIKCDIEGGEWNFLINYTSILEKSKFLVMEWHSWHTGGEGFPQIEKRLTEFGFQIIKSSPPKKAVGRDGEVGLFLAKNLNFQN